MTENKRFVIDDNGYLIDGDTHKLIEYDEECCELLNELHEENNVLRLMLNSCSDQRNEFHRGARENANRVGKLEKENEQLKKDIEYYKIERLALFEYLDKKDDLKLELKVEK